MGEEVGGVYIKDEDVFKWCVGKDLGILRIRFFCYWQEKGKEVDSWIRIFV